MREPQSGLRLSLIGASYGMLASIVILILAGIEDVFFFVLLTPHTGESGEGDVLIGVALFFALTIPFWIGLGIVGGALGGWLLSSARQKRVWAYSFVVGVGFALLSAFWSLVFLSISGVVLVLLLTAALVLGLTILAGQVIFRLLHGEQLIQENLQADESVRSLQPHRESTITT